MNAVSKPEADALKPAGLELLRQPVPDHLISPLPKGTKAQNDCSADQKINCKICGGWHHKNIRHLDYVGHAAATHLLLDADPQWDWTPLAFDANGLPKFDESGGLWIRLIVCGVSRLGYGHADKKQHMDAGSREKEVIGDALRNAAMRFGLALDLWSKADIHAGSTNERDTWFETCATGIKTAANVGELKARTAAAITEAKARNDQEAEDDFLIAQAEKMARAKPPADRPKALGSQTQQGKINVFPDLQDDDITY